MKRSTHRIDTPLALLGGLSARQFMRTYWQRRPLLVRQALPGLKPPVSAAALKKLSRSDAVESRLIWREAGQWCMEQGPFARLPANTQPHWTLLVQSMDIHDDTCAELLHRFDFVPSARLDDLMISIASDGGGVGPHFDSYDVFLIQASGRRRWRFGMQRDLSLVPELPLKILSKFQPEQDVILEPGDMLYLPPRAAHDGVAVGDGCMTLSVGFRAPDGATLARGMLEAAADQVGLLSQSGNAPAANQPSGRVNLSWRFSDPGQPAVTTPAALPDTLLSAALKAVGRVRFDRRLATQYLGCWFTEPNALAVFEARNDEPVLAAGLRLRLDRRSRLLYFGHELFINGERAPVRASQPLKRLADQRELALTDRMLHQLSPTELDCLRDWLQAGWLTAQPDSPSRR